jgi:hypothetical protein
MRRSGERLRRSNRPSACAGAPLWVLRGSTALVKDAPSRHVFARRVDSRPVVASTQASHDLGWLRVASSSQDATVGVVRAVMERDVAGIGVKDRNDLRLGIPVRDVAFDDLHAEN